MGQNRGTLVNIKIDGKWMFIHPNMAPEVLTHGHIGSLTEIAEIA